MFKQRLIIAGLIAVLLAAGGSALAMQQGDYFELDGNAVDDPGGGIDWETIYADEGVLLTDMSGANDDNAFTQGGSKDINDIPEWRHTTSSVPDKDDILHAFVAAYALDDGLTFFFGADRFANNGDAQLGFWFFHEVIEPLPDGTFSGQHSDGDLLVLTNFVRGGAVSNIQIYRWDEQAGALTLVGEQTVENDLAVCVEGDLACALTNSGGEQSPWPFTPKSGDSGQFPAASFVEGSVNISALLNEGVAGCYSSFLAETRSSQETNAQLKDFTSGSLDLCGLTVTKSGGDLSKVGDPVTYTYTIENTGLVTLYAQSYQDQVAGDIRQAASDAGCDVLDAGDRCDFSVTYTVQPADPDPLTGDMTAVYNTRLDGSGDGLTASDGHETNLFQPSITFEKTIDVEQAASGDDVNYTLTLINTSSSDSPGLTCLVSDEILAVSLNVNLAPGEEYVKEAVYTVNDTDSNPLVNVATVSCQVDGFPNVLKTESEANLQIVEVDPSTPEPTEEPTDEPTEVPTEEPTDEPTEVPTEEPTDEPTEVPTEEPTDEPEETETPEPEETQTPEPDPDPTSEPLTGQGCSPGFWQGGYGRYLWDEENDPDWKGQGSNPYTHDTSFNDVFEPYSSADGYNVYAFVRRGGGPMHWRKAARGVVAGYLNASYGMNYPFTPAEVADMWADAVQGIVPFIDVHKTLDEANNLGCPLGD